MLLTSQILEANYAEIQTELLADLNVMLERNDLSVVILNDAGPNLLMNAFAQGKIAYEDEATRPAIGLLVYALSRFSDWQAHTKKHQRLIQQSR